ncbi:MAG: sulfurtransferase TusA family protein [Candidatus Rokuibacteriota bacterium]
MVIVPDRKIDCVGLFCPMPILKTREAMKRIESGQILEMTSDDPASDADVRSWSARTGNQLVSMERNGPIFRFLIRKI